MNDIERLAAHRAAETEGQRSPAQRRHRFDADDHPRPWTYHKTHAFAWHVADAVGLIVATGLSQRDARIIASAPMIAALADGFAKDVDAELTRVDL